MSNSFRPLGLRQSRKSEDLTSNVQPINIISIEPTARVRGFAHAGRFNEAAIPRFISSTFSRM
jgi:hypothetical protein